MNCSLLAFVTVQSHRALKVVEIPPVAVNEEFLRFSELLFEVGMQFCVNQPSRCRTRCPQRLLQVFFLLPAHESSGIPPRIP